MILLPLSMMIFKYLHAIHDCIHEVSLNHFTLSFSKLQPKNTIQGKRISQKYNTGQAGAAQQGNAR